LVHCIKYHGRSRCRCSSSQPASRIPAAKA
jgi:hypothetical protein